MFFREKAQNKCFSWKRPKSKRFVKKVSVLWNLLWFVRGCMTRRAKKSYSHASLGSSLKTCWSMTRMNSQNDLINVLQVVFGHGRLYCQNSFGRGKESSPKWRKAKKMLCSLRDINSEKIVIKGGLRESAQHSQYEQNNQQNQIGRTMVLCELETSPVDFHFTCVVGLPVSSFDVRQLA